MPRVTVPAKFVGETRNWLVDFTGLFSSSSATITDQIVQVSVYSGVDTNPTVVLSGAASHSGLVVTQALTGGVAGVIYYLTCSVIGSAGEVIEVSAFLAVVPDVV